MVLASEIVSSFEDMLVDPDLKREVEMFAKISGCLSAAELDQRFTV